MFVFSFGMFVKQTKSEMETYDNNKYIQINVFYFKLVLDSLIFRLRFLVL